MADTITSERAHLLNDNILEIIESIMGDTTTYDSSLDKVASKLLGKAYEGTFPSDHIPSNLEEGQCAIINLDTSNESGSHWVAALRHMGDLCIYDSFGRKASNILPAAATSGNGQVVDADRDREQRNRETNCGQRCISWLCLAKHWSPELAMRV